MKLLSLFLALAVLTGCQSKTDLGECIGIQDDPSPSLEYKWSTRNLIIGAVFSEMIVVPAVVLLTEAKCPVARK